MRALVALPPPRDPNGGTYSLALVCLGNICRSPIAFVVLERRLSEAGLASRVSLDSAGTGTWHLGEPMDHRAADTLAAAGYEPSQHRARRFDSGWFAGHDAILVMDQSNREAVLALAPTEADRERVLMFRAFDPLAPPEPGLPGALDVPDPWFGGRSVYDEVLAIVERTADVLVRALADT